MADSHSAQLRADLLKHPSWQALRGEADRKIESLLVGLARRLARMEAGTIPAEELQYLRGRIRGMQDLLKDPDKALRDLDKLVEREDTTV
jgi:hypothetical protein